MINQKWPKERERGLEREREVVLLVKKIQDPSLDATATLFLVRFFFACFKNFALRLRPELRLTQFWSDKLSWPIVHKNKNGKILNELARTQFFILFFPFKFKILRKQGSLLREFKLHYSNLLRDQFVQLYLFQACWEFVKREKLARSRFRKFPFSWKLFYKQILKSTQNFVRWTSPY